MSPTDERKARHISRALLFAPLIFVCHFLEESPGFVGWFNSHVARGITQGLFWRVNITALVITVAVAAFERFSRSSLSMILALTWLGFLMLANALFHITGGLVDGRYMPGLLTAILLYLPYYLWLFVTAVKSGRVNIAAAAACALLGALPMLAHGYLILFRGSRLF